MVQLLFSTVSRDFCNTCCSCHGEIIYNKARVRLPVVTQRCVLGRMCVRILQRVSKSHDIFHAERNARNPVVGLTYTYDSCCRFIVSTSPAT